MTRQLTSAVRHKLLRSPHAKRPPHGRLRSKSVCRKSSIASDCVLGSRHRDVAAGDCQFGWLQGVRNRLRQNSFWLQRPDLNLRNLSQPRICSRGRRVTHPYCPEDVAWRFSGVTSGGTWIVNFRRLAAPCGEPNFSHLYEMARLGKCRQFRASCSEWLKRPLLYH
jgi:hypothetical protein